MTHGGDLADPVYRVGGRQVSMLDLLRRFSEPQYQLDGVWRLSDLHLKVGEPACYRFDSQLGPLPDAEPLSPGTLERLVFPLLTAAQIAGLRAQPPRDVDAGYELPGEGLSFRINAFHDRDGLACAIRVLPRRIPRVENIGFPTEQVWREIVEMQQGLVIVTGVTGSGKSTTVASLIEHINETRKVRIITLEDPVEYVLASRSSLISQRELGKHIESFEQGLRSALREDPDVIFVGEMRDRDTTALALSAAETGHLVLSTLHTRDARGTITRIVDMFPEERTREVATQLSFSLSFVLAQRLVPRAGRRGRRVAMEVLKNVPAVANLVRTGRWHQLYSTIEAHRKQGLITLERHLSELASRGEVSKDDARRYANDPSMVD
jgi:twitching motility protein PilT